LALQVGEMTEEGTRSLFQAGIGVFVIVHDVFCLVLGKVAVWSECMEWNEMDGVWGLGRRAGEGARNLKLSNAGKAIVDLALLIWPSNLKDGWERNPRPGEGAGRVCVCYASAVF